MRLVQEASQGQGGEAAPQGEPVYKKRWNLSQKSIRVEVRKEYTRFMYAPFLL